MNRLVFSQYLEIREISIFLDDIKDLLIKAFIKQSYNDIKAFVCIDSTTEMMKHAEAFIERMNIMSSMRSLNSNSKKELINMCLDEHKEDLEGLCPKDFVRYYLYYNDLLSFVRDHLNLFNSCRLLLEQSKGFAS